MNIWLAYFSSLFYLVSLANISAVIMQNNLFHFLFFHHRLKALSQVKCLIFVCQANEKKKKNHLYAIVWNDKDTIFVGGWRNDWCFTLSNIVFLQVVCTNGGEKGVFIGGIFKRYKRNSKQKPLYSIWFSRK